MYLQSFYTVQSVTYRVFQHRICKRNINLIYWIVFNWFSAVGLLPPLLHEDSGGRRLTFQVKHSEVSLCWERNTNVSILDLNYIKDKNAHNLLTLPKSGLQHCQTHKQQKQIFPSLPLLGSQYLIIKCMGNWSKSGTEQRLNERGKIKINTTGFYLDKKYLLISFFAICL